MFQEGEAPPTSRPFQEPAPPQTAGLQPVPLPPGFREQALVSVPLPEPAPVPVLQASQRVQAQPRPQAPFTLMAPAFLQRAPQQVQQAPAPIQQQAPQAWHVPQGAPGPASHQFEETLVAAVAEPLPCQAQQETLQAQQGPAPQVLGDGARQRRLCEKCGKPTPDLGSGNGRPAGTECECPTCVICLERIISETEEVLTMPCYHVSWPECYI